MSYTVEGQKKKTNVGCSSRCWVIIPTTCVLFAVRATASDLGGFVMLFTLFWYARMRARVYWHFSSVRCFVCFVSQFFSLYYLCTRGDSRFLLEGIFASAGRAYVFIVCRNGYVCARRRM